MSTTSTAQAAVVTKHIVTYTRVTGGSCRRATSFVLLSWEGVRLQGIEHRVGKFTCLYHSSIGPEYLGSERMLRRQLVTVKEYSLRLRTLSVPLPSYRAMLYSHWCLSTDSLSLPLEAGRTVSWRACRDALTLSSMNRAWKFHLV